MEIRLTDFEKSGGRNVSGRNRINNILHTSLGGIDIAWNSQEKQADLAEKHVLGNRK